MPKNRKGLWSQTTITRATEKGKDQQYNYNTFSRVKNKTRNILATVYQSNSLQTGKIQWYWCQQATIIKLQNLQ